MHNFPSVYDPTIVEEKWGSFWEAQGFYTADPHSKKPPFSIVIPPPNVTGVLHMGHALVDTIQDILIRWKRMQGYEVLWIPGTDHAGIATQTVVERNLYIKTGKRRSAFGREEFLCHVWDWKETCETQILGQLRKLGCSCDWSRLRFTMDEGCNAAVRAAFKKMFDDGLIYRGDYLVNWDPVAGTALSDDEVEYEERPSFLWHIRYPLAEGSGAIVVATTRPETMLGDTALAVHPSDERYAHWIGQRVKLPLSDREIPVIGDPFVDPAFGTGAVKITPAHDFNDFEAGRRHNLPSINILTPDAKINEKGGQFAGLAVEEARIAVVHALKSEGFLEKVDPYLLRVGVSYRSKAVIQPYLSKQWFVKMSHFKEKLISAVKESRVKLIPPHWETTYLHWIENLRDWCISRQLWWGHRIPVWYGPQAQVVCWDQDGAPPEAEREPELWHQDEDVLDTWFSSGIWPLSTLGWPKKTAELAKFYPTSVLVTGHDILFFWVARMILMGEYFVEKPPFHAAFLHGLIYGKSYWKKNSDGSSTYILGEEKIRYDLGEPLPPGIESKWEKMSKTKGNIIDPLEILTQYGTDALRIALCSSVTYARQIDLDRRRFEEYKNFANKIWNGARFVLMHMEDLSAQKFSEGLDRERLSLEDRWMLSTLNRTIRDVERHLSEYTFDKAAARAYEFFWNDFCAIYLEASKPVLFQKSGTPLDREKTQKILLCTLIAAVRLLHPITPFITEEIFSLLQARFPQIKASPESYCGEAIRALQSAACIVAPYPLVQVVSDIDEEVEKTFMKIYDLVRIVRKIRTDMQIPLSEKTKLYFSGEKASEDWDLIEKNQGLLLALTPTETIFFSETEPQGFGANALWGTLRLTLPLPEALKEKEKARLYKEKEKLEKARLETASKLDKPEFREKAPAEIIAKLATNLKVAKRQIEEIDQKLLQL